MSAKELLSIILWFEVILQSPTEAKLSKIKNNSCKGVRHDTT